MTRLVGLLSWYNERPSWLSACITSYAQAGVTHLVAIDGAYALYPDGTARSTSLEHEAITDTCDALNLHLTLILPDGTWAGNEVEKRTALFRHAEVLTDPSDWLIVMDADEIVTSAPADLHDTLADTPYDAAEVTLWQRDTLDTPGAASAAQQFPHDPRSQHPIRKLFRAARGLHCAGNHYTYRTGDGRNLWGEHRLELAHDLTQGFHIEHRSIHRAMHRRQQARDYYERRDRHGIERGKA